MEPPRFPTEESPPIKTQVGASTVLELNEPTGTKPFLYKWSRGGTSLEDRFTSAVERGVVRLTVTSAQADDAGVYTLEASNKAGTDTARVRLEVEDPPTFLRRLQDLSVKVGSRTRFLVEIASSTECQVTWYRNERRLLEAERVTLAHEGNFWCAEVAPVSVEDAGRWTCTAENVAGRTSCSGHLNVLVPKAYKRPEFVEELRALLTEQGTVSLECKVVGVPTPVLRWFKDSKEIKAGDVFALTANAEDPTSLGTYTCEAVNCMGRAYSSSKVHVVGRASREGSMPSAITQEPPPIFTREMEDHSVKICGQLRLSCRALVPPWPRSVVWYNKEGKVEAGERYQMVEDGAGGYMIEIASSEWCDEGEWKCVATSAGGRVSVSTCHVAMDVPHNYRAPRFMESLSAVLTEEGLVSFECKVVGFPTPLLRWFKDGHELKPGDVYHLTGTNSLGSYCCIARNCMGQASSSAELTVEDIQSQLNEEEKLQLFSKNQAPKFILGLKSVEAKIDEPFRFNVKVNTPPEPSVSWYRDEQPVDESNRCHLGQEDKGIFFIDIQNLEFMDQSEWKCVAMNDYGHSVTSCFLKLIIPRHYKKPRFLENLQAILSDEGAVNLECKVIGVPQPILKWYKDGEELKPGDIHRIISGQDGTCCLGTYTCEAQNCMGIAASSASLLGYDDPTKVKAKKITTQQSLERNLSLSTIHEERTSQMYDTPVGDITLDDKGEVSFSFDGKEVSVSLYETPDLTEEEALQIVEMYADQLSENVTEHNVVELPPLRFVKETSTSGNLLMEAIIIDVSPEYFVSPEDDLRTEADVDDISNADEIGPQQLSLDQDISGENYLEKTMALISEEKSDIPKIIRRKKSESQKSGEDFFSLSRDQSLSDGKDDDTHVLSASDLESFASAKSSAKNISKPLTKEGVAESDEKYHKTVIQENIEVINEEIIKTPVPDNDSDKEITKNDVIVIDDEDINMNVIHIDKHFSTKMISISNSLDEVINKAQLVEKDIISKCELMSSAIAASKSLEVINGLMSPLIEIQSTANTIGDSSTQNINTMSSSLKHFVKSLKSLQQASTMIEKCIEIKSESKTLVQKTCGKLIENCGDDLQNVVQEFKDTLSNYKLYVDEKTKKEIDILTSEIKTALILSSDTIKTNNLLTEAEEITQVNELSADMKHVKETQKVIFLFKNTLNSLLCIVENAEKCNSRKELKIGKIDVVLNDMSSTVLELQTVLERIESLSVNESTSSFTTYNTEIIENVMESVLNLRSSFEELSGKSSEDSESLKIALTSIKNILCDIYANVNAIDQKVGSFDILQSENKLDVLQKIAQSLITLESNLVNLDSIPEIKSHFCTFHKNLTKVLEKVLENNNSKQYIALVEICDTVNRVNNNIKLIDSDNILAFASLCNSIDTIRGHFDKTIFEKELNDSVISNIKDVLICLEQALNIAEEVSVRIDSEHAAEKKIEILDFTKAQLLIEHIECTIATIGYTSVLDTTHELKKLLTPTLENIIPSLEELKKNIAIIQNTNVNKDELLSDLSELSFSDAVANPLCELNQNIVILNQNISEHIHEIKNQSEISYKFAETLHELHTTLEIMQQNIISQYDDDFIPYEVSVNVASAIQNLQSCIVMVEENAGADAIDDMSTLEDISGIKTSAEMISEEHIMAVPAATGTITNYFASSLEQESIPVSSAEALYYLNEHITVLKNPEIMDALDTLSDVSDLTSLKTVNMNLQELCMAIEEILHPIALESITHLSNISNITRLLAIAQPMQELSKSLSVFDVKDVPIYEEILEMPSEKVYSLIHDVNSFREQLQQCIETVISPLENVNMTVEVSNKVRNVRDMCCQLKYILRSTTCLSENVPIQLDSITKLEKNVDELLRATDTTHEFSMKQIKLITEELYKLTMSVQDSVIHFVPQSADKLAQEVKLVQCMDELEKSIAVLEQYEFIDLSKVSELTVNSNTQFVVELKTEPLSDVESVVENIVHILQDKIHESKEENIDNLVYIEEFFKNCKNEFVIIRCLISRPLTHKKLLRVLQEVINLESLIENFKSTHANSEISNDFNICLNNFFTHSTECLQNIKKSITNIVVSQSEVLFKIPLRKLNETVYLIENKVPDGTNMSDIANNFKVILKNAYSNFENLELCVLSELKTSTSMYSNSDEIVKNLMNFVSYADTIRSDLSTNERCHIMLTEILLSIKRYNEFESASSTGMRLILLKCLSECCDIINKYLGQTKTNDINELSEKDLSCTSLKPILKEALVHLKTFNNQLNIIQESILSGIDQDTLSLDMSSTESMVQSVTEACKEITKLENDLVSEVNIDLNKQEYHLIQEVDKEIHSIQENMKIIHDIPVIQNVKIVSEPLDAIDIMLQSILSIEPSEQKTDSYTGMSVLNETVESESMLENIEEATGLSNQQHKNVAQMGEQMQQVETKTIELSTVQDVLEIKEESVKKSQSINHSTHENSPIDKQTICQVLGSEIQSAEKVTDLPEQRQDVTVAITQIEDQVLQLETEIVEASKAEDVLEIKNSTQIEDQVLQLETEIVKASIAEDVLKIKNDIINETSQKNTLIAKQIVCQVLSSKLESEEKILETKTDIVQVSVAQDMSDIHKKYFKETSQEDNIIVEQVISEVLNSEFESSKDVTDLHEQNQVVDIAISQAKEQMHQLDTNFVIADQMVCQVPSSELESAENTTDLPDLNEDKSVAITQTEEYMPYIKTDIVQLSVAQDMSEIHQNTSNIISKASSSELENIEVADLHEEMQADIMISKTEDQMLQLKTDIVEASLAQDVLENEVKDIVEVSIAQNMSEIYQKPSNETSQENNLISEQFMSEIAISKLKSSEEVDLCVQKQVVDIAISQTEEQMPQLDTTVVEVSPAQSVLEIEEEIIITTTPEKSLISEQIVCEVSSSELESLEKATDLPDLKQDMSVAVTKTEEKILDMKTEKVQLSVAQDMSQIHNVSSCELEKLEVTDLHKQKQVSNIAISQTQEQMPQLETNIVEGSLALDVLETEMKNDKKTTQEKIPVTEQFVCEALSSKLESAEETKYLREQTDYDNIQICQTDEEISQLKTEIVKTYRALDVLEITRDTTQENSLSAEETVCQVSSCELESAEEATDLCEQKQVLNVAIRQTEDKMTTIKSENMDVAQNVLEIAMETVNAITSENSPIVVQTVCQVSSSELESVEKSTDLPKQKQDVTVANSQIEKQLPQLETDIVKYIGTKDVLEKNNGNFKESTQEMNLNIEQSICQVSSSEFLSAEETTDLCELVVSQLSSNKLESTTELSKPQQVVNVAISEIEKQMPQLKSEIVKETTQDKNRVIEQGVCQISNSDLESFKEIIDLGDREQVVNVAVIQTEEQMIPLETKFIKPSLQQDVIEIKEETNTAIIQEKSLIAKKTICQITSIELEGLVKATELPVQKENVNVAIIQIEEQMPELETKIVETSIEQHSLEIKEEIATETTQGNNLITKNDTCHVLGSTLERAKETTDMFKQKQILNIASSQTEEQISQLATEVVEVPLRHDVLEIKEEIVNATTWDKSLITEKSICQVSSSKLESAEKATELPEQEHDVNVAITQIEELMPELETKIVETSIAQDNSEIKEENVNETNQEKSLIIEQAIFNVSSSELETANNVSELCEQKQALDVSKNLMTEQAVFQLPSSNLKSTEKASNLKKTQQVINVAKSEIEEQILQVASDIVKPSIVKNILEITEESINDTTQENTFTAEKTVCQVSSIALESEEEATQLCEQKQIVNIATSQTKEQMPQLAAKVIEVPLRQNVLEINIETVKIKAQEKSLIAEKEICKITSSELECAEKVTELPEQDQDVNVAIVKIEEQIPKLETKIVETSTKEDVLETKDESVHGTIQVNNLIADESVYQVSSSSLDSAEKVTDQSKQKQIVNIATSQTEEQVPQLATTVIKVNVFSQDMLENKKETDNATTQENNLIQDKTVCHVSSSELESRKKVSNISEQKPDINVALIQIQEQMPELDTKIIETLTKQNVLEIQDENVNEITHKNDIIDENTVCQVLSSTMENAEEATVLCEQKQIVNIVTSQTEEQMPQIASKIFEVPLRKDVSEINEEIVKIKAQEKILDAEKTICKVSNSELEGAGKATKLPEQDPDVNVAIIQIEEQEPKLEINIVETSIKKDVLETKDESVYETIQENNLIVNEAVYQVSNSALESAEKVTDQSKQKQIVNIATSQTQEQVPQLATNSVKLLLPQDVIEIQEETVKEFQEKSLIAKTSVCLVSSSELKGEETATNLPEQNQVVNVAINQIEEEMSTLGTEIVEASIAQDMSEIKEITVKETNQEKCPIDEHAVFHISSNELGSMEKASDLCEQRLIENFTIKSKEQMPQLKTEFVEASITQDVSENQEESVKSISHEVSFVTEQAVCQKSTNEVQILEETTDLYNQNQDVNNAISQIEEQISDNIVVSKDNVVHENIDVVDKSIASVSEPLEKLSLQEQYIDIKLEEQCKPDNNENLQSVCAAELSKLITDFKQLATIEYSEEVTTLSSVMNVDALKESITIVKDLLVNIASSSIQNTPSMECVTHDMMEKLSYKQSIVIKDVESALTVIQYEPMENTEKLAINTVAEHIVKLATQLQQDLSNAMQNPSVIVLEKLSDLLQESNQQISTQERLFDLQKKVNDVIKESENKENLDHPESLRDVMDEVQTVIIKIKWDIDRVPNHTVNETLEDLECSVRSVQLQNNEQSRLELVKEVSDGLKSLLSNIEADKKVIQSINQSPETLAEIVTNCDQSTIQTLSLLELLSKSDIKSFITLITSLKNVKENLQSLRMLFISNHEEIINKGIEVLLKLEQTEDKIQILQKNLLSENKLKPETGKSIINAINSVSKSIEIMRSTLSSIQKQFLYENYGKPLDNLLQSLRNVSLICKLENKNNICLWKSLAKSIRKTLDHFEDIKFYVNLDKSARIPSKSAVTEHILNELKSSIINTNVCLELMENETISKSLNEIVSMLDDQIITIKSSPTIAVNEKIPLFKNCSAKLNKFTEKVKIALQNIKDKSNVMTDKIPDSLEKVVIDEIKQGMQEVVEANTESRLSDIIEKEKVKTQIDTIIKSPSEQQAECLPYDVVNEVSFDFNELSNVSLVNAEQGTHLFNECHIEHNIIYEKENKGNVSDVITEHAVEGTSVVEEQDKFEKAQIYKPSLVDAPALTTKNIYNVKYEESKIIIPESSISQIEEINGKIVDLTKDTSTTTSQKNYNLDTVDKYSECNNNTEKDNSNLNAMNLSDLNKASSSVNNIEKSIDTESSVQSSTALKIDTNIETKEKNKINSDKNSDFDQNKIQIKTQNEQFPVKNVELSVKSQEVNRSSEIIINNVSNLDKEEHKNVTQLTKDDEQSSKHLPKDVHPHALEENSNSANKNHREVMEIKENFIQIENVNATESSIDIMNKLLTDDDQQTNSNAKTLNFVSDDLQNIQKSHSVTEKDIRNNLKQEEEKVVIKHVEENKDDAKRLSKTIKIVKTLDKKKPHDTNDIKKSKKEIIRKSKVVDSENVEGKEIVNMLSLVDTSLTMNNSENSKSQGNECSSSKTQSKEIIQNDNLQSIKGTQQLHSYESEIDNVKKIRKYLSKTDLDTSSNFEINKSLKINEPAPNWKGNDLTNNKEINLKEDYSEFNLKSEISVKDLLNEGVDESHIKQRNIYSAYVKEKTEDQIYKKDISNRKPISLLVGDTDTKYSDSLLQSKNKKTYNRYTLDQCVDTNKIDFDKPPNYNQRNSGLDFTESFHIPNNHMSGRCDPVYKAKSLVPESRLRSKTPGTTPSSEDLSERQRLRIRKTASPRSFSVEKSSSVPRDLKRKPVFSTYLTDRTAVEGSRVKLTCSVLSSSDPKVTWYRNGNLLDNKLKYRTKFSDGLITLEVLNAVPTDSAEYSCVVENDNGAVSCNANLKVYPCFESSPIPPTFTRSIRDAYHMAENELVLECRIRGQPLPIITWLKDDVPISSKERYQAYYLADGVCRLCISVPTNDDSGKYTCRAENSVWSDQITHVVNFTGKESRLDLNLTTTERTKFARQALESRRPHFSNVLTDHAVSRGGTIGLQVEIRGAPTRVEWLREGTSINESYRNARTFVEQGLYTLALSDVTEKESGLYTCRAWSSHGNVDMNASVTVVQPSDVKEGKPAILVSRPEKDVLISVGEDLNVSFRVQGEPKPKVIWMKGTRDITNNDRVCKMTSDDYMKFTLKRSVVSDAGTYCVLARNAYGCDRAFITVVVRQRASSENLIRDWTYPSEDSHLAHSDRSYKPLPGRIPGEPSAIDGGDNWLSLCWPKPDAGVAPVLAYKIEVWRVGADGGARWSELGITPLNSYDVFNLKRGDQYHFRVTPRNRYGWGETVQTTHPISVGHSGDRPEFVELLPGQLKVMLGEKATLGCVVQANPLPDILWTKNGHEMEESDKRIGLTYDGHNCRLTIDEVTMDDEGRYSCEATNGFGRTSTYARLAVVTDKKIWEADAKLKRERSAECDGEYPPQFTLRLRDRRVQASYPVRLTCQIIGSPAPQVTWFKNGVKIHRDDRHSMFQDEHFHTLEIAPTTLEDGGVYEAMARNTRAALSCRCNLVVDKGIRAYVAPEFCCGLQPLYRYLEGEELRVSAVVEAYPSVGVSWYRDGIRLRPSRRTIMTLDRDGVVELALAAVTPRDAGVYSCTASNEVGTATTSGRVDVIEGLGRKDIPQIEQPMMYPPDVPYSKEPMFVRKPRSSEAREGDTVIIECEVVGDPKPDVFWLRDFLKPDYYRDATHFRRIGSGPEYRLEIPHAKFDHTGAYSVLAKNIYGEAKAVISLQILAKDPDSTDSHNVSYGRVETLPRFVRELCDVVCCDGDVVQFQCEVSGTPFPDIKWVKYNQVIHESDDFEFTCDESEVILRIKRVTAEDEGAYVCEASNVLGRTTSSACLIVYPPGEPNMLSQQLRRPPAFQSAQSTPRSTPRATPARSRSLSRTPVPETRRLYSPSRRVAPKFYTYPHNKVVEEGGYATFRCAVTGHPSPWTSWDKDGVPVTPSTRITVKEKEDTRLLEIEEVTIEDAGLYRIVLENDHGRSESSARLDVITRRGKYYGGVRSYSVSPRRATSSGRRLASVSRYTPVPDRREMSDDRLRVIDHENDTQCEKPKNQS